MKTCKQVTYWGRVQGVGFRYTAYGLAQQYPVTGYVQNMLDGQVLLLAEGEAEDVDIYLEAINNQMGRFIKGQSIQDLPPQGFANFEIR
jgi:acylphosphatase